MESKTKKAMLIASITFIIIVFVSILYMINSTKDLEFRSGTYYCKINILNKGNTRVFQWDVGTYKNNTKTIIESEVNGESLEQFRKAISELGIKKFSLFLLIIYLIYVLVIFLFAQKDSKIYKKENNKKLFQLFIALLIFFLIYKIIISYIELNRLHIIIRMIRF